MNGEMKPFLKPLHRKAQMARSSRTFMSDKAKVILKAISGGMAALSFLTIMITAAFFATSFIYTQIGYHPPAVVVQIINTLMGVFFAFLIMFCLAMLFRSKRLDMEMGMFRPITDAIGKIAKGDFSVRVDASFHEHDIAGKLAKSVNTMAIELDQMEVMRQEFISNVSHEIQSPLTSIRGFARALQNEHLSPTDRSHYLNIIELESMRLSKLSDNLLALAALDDEHSAFDPKTYRLDRQIRNLILACEPQWTDKSIEMDVSFEEVTISADEDLLSQVWVNLIYNSIKFTPHGGRICVDLYQQDGSIAFGITDTGIGISEEDQYHIFERFFKAEKARDRAKGGSGLGLAIAKKIVEMHKGTIGVESELGAGTSFIVSLPVGVCVEVGIE